MREHIATITKKDLTIQTFRSGGKGGQHQNKTDSGVRIIHNESRAVGECRNFSSQHHNKKEALKRLIETKKFKLWVNRIVHEHSTGKSVEQEVNEMMIPSNLKIEVRKNGRWEDE